MAEEEEEDEGTGEAVASDWVRVRRRLLTLRRTDARREALGGSGIEACAESTPSG